MKFWKSIKVNYNDNKEMWDYVMKNTPTIFYIDSESGEGRLIEIGIDAISELVDEYLYIYLYEDKPALDKEIIELIEFMLELGYDTYQVGDEAYLVNTKETENISDITLF